MAGRSYGTRCGMARARQLDIDPARKLVDHEIVDRAEPVAAAAIDRRDQQIAQFDREYEDYWTSERRNIPSDMKSF